MRPCPRCGVTVPPSEANHEYHCLEHHLVALYNMGVQRGVAGESEDDGFDDKAAEMIGRILELAWEWRATGREARATTAEVAATQAMAVMLSGTRPGTDVDTLVAKFLEWQNVGWLYGQPVSGESAWADPRVIRRRFSQRLEDALPLLSHPLLKPYELIRIHRISTQSWEWHVIRRDRWGTMESLIVAPSAPMAICRAALRLSGLAPRERETA